MKCIRVQLFWQPANTTDSNMRQILGFPSIKAKDLSKRLAARMKVYVQDLPKMLVKSLRSWHFSVSNRKHCILKGYLHQAQPFFLVVGISSSREIFNSTGNWTHSRLPKIYAPRSFKLGRRYCMWLRNGWAQRNMTDPGPGTQQFSSAPNRHPALHSHYHLLSASEPQGHVLPMPSHLLAASLPADSGIAGVLALWSHAMPPAKAEAHRFLSIVYLFSKVKHCLLNFSFFRGPCFSFIVPLSFLILLMILIILYLVSSVPLMVFVIVCFLVLLCFCLS